MTSSALREANSLSRYRPLSWGDTRYTAQLVESYRSGEKESGIETGRARTYGGLRMPRLEVRHSLLYPWYTGNKCNECQIYVVLEYRN